MAPAPARLGNRLMQQARRLLVVAAEQVVEHQRVGLLALAPEHHQDDDFELVEGNRFVAGSQCPFDHDLALNRIDDLGCFQKLDEADGRRAQG